jgi:hypothetical protein
MRTPPDVCAGALGNQHREIRVKKLMRVAPGLALLAALVALTVGIGSGVSSVASKCTGGDSGKIDLFGEDRPSTLTVTAPDGFLITGYCVKSGSVNQEGTGPEYYTVNPPAASVEISHSTGKAISHYSFTYVQGEDEYCPPEDTTGCADVSGE